jgi:hypothetical protein
VENGSLEPLLILMDIVAKGQCHAIGSEGVLAFQREQTPCVEQS